MIRPTHTEDVSSEHKERLQSLLHRYQSMGEGCQQNLPSNLAGRVKIHTMRPPWLLSVFSLPLSVLSLLGLQQVDSEACNRRGIAQHTLLCCIYTAAADQLQCRVRAQGGVGQWWLLLATDLPLAVCPPSEKIKYFLPSLFSATTALQQTLAKKSDFPRPSRHQLLAATP